MLICTYLVAIAGYLFPVKMPKSSRRSSPLLPTQPPPVCPKVLAWAFILGRQWVGPPALQSGPQLPGGWRKPQDAGEEERRAMGRPLRAGRRRIKQKCKLPKPVINISSKSP